LADARALRAAASTTDDDDGYPTHSLLNAFRLLCTGNRQARARSTPLAPARARIPCSCAHAARPARTQVAVENHSAAVGSYTQALHEAVAAFQHGVQTSRELGRIRLGNMPGMDAPTVEIHKHLTGALLCNRSACWRRMGNAWRAISDAEAAIETFVEWGTCHARLAEALESCGDAAAALRSYRRAVAFSPGVPEFQTRLDALLRCVLGSSDVLGGPLANPEARWVAGGGGPPRLWLELRAACCCASLDLGDALWRATESLQHGDCGAFYAEQQQFIEAALGVVASNAGFAMLEGVLEAGIEHFDKPKKAFVSLAVGNIFAWVGDYDAASAFYSKGVEAVESGVRRSPEDWLVTLLCNRALCRLRLGQRDAAASDARRALSCRPDWPRAHARAGDCAAEAADWAGAAGHYSAALKLCAPGSPLAMDVNSRLAAASRAGRGAPSPLGSAGGGSGSESPLLPRSAASSPLPGSGGGRLTRNASNSSFREGALDLGEGGEEGDEARVQAALSSFIRNRRQGGKRHGAARPGREELEDDDGGYEEGDEPPPPGSRTPGTRTPTGGLSKSPKRSKAGTPEEGSTPGRRSPIEGGPPGSDPASMNRFARDVLASFAAMGAGGDDGGDRGVGERGGGGGASLPPAQLRYTVDLGGLFSDGPDGGFSMAGDDFLLDALVGADGGYGDEPR
jgi:tetratricopeptide (TPR) repeat protein